MKALFGILTVVVCNHLVGNEYTFERLTSKNGLSQNNVLDIFQCSDGYLWLATFDGLNRYNGYDFKVYYNSVEDSNSLASNLILSIKEDSNNNLWISTFNDGICLFNKGTEEFTTFKNTPDNPDLLVSNETASLFCDSRNNIWVTCSFGVTYLEIEGDEVVKSVKFMSTDNPKSLINNVVTYVYEDSQGRIFFMTEGGLDMLIFDEPGNYKNEFVHIGSKYNLSRLQSIKETKEGFIFLHFNGLSLLKLDEDNPEDSEIIPIDEHLGHLLTTDKNGDLWTAGYYGLNKYKYTGDENQPYVFEKHFEAGEGKTFISQDRLRSLAVDDAGILWIGTHGSGMMKCNTNNPRFKHFKNTNQQGSLSANKVWSIFEDSSDNLWFTTEGGGLNFLPAKEGRNYGSGFVAYRVNPPKMQNTAYQMIEIGTKENPEFLVGVGYSNKVVHLTQHNREWEIKQRFPQIKHQVMALCNDDNNIAWLGTYMGGLFRCYLHNDLDFVVNYTTYNSLLPSLVVRSITKDSKGRLWIGTDQGLALLTAKEKVKEHPSFIVFKNIPGDKTSISHNYTVPVVETTNGEIWIGTFGGGLNKYVEGNTETNGTFVRYGLKEGLPNNTIKQIVEDDFGNLWVTSNLGLSRIDTSRENIRNYSISDGLQDLEFIDLSGIKLSDGQIILGGINGFNTFYPEEIVEDSVPPVLVFEDLMVMNEIVQVNMKYGGEIILGKNINLTEKIVLKHNQHSFTISFSALHFTVPEGNQFKYMLEGFDTEWVNTSSKARFARYTNISAGTYTFKFLASNCNGLWAKKPKTITIVVKPPFWKTWWFVTLTCLMGIIAVLFVFYWRTRVIRLRNMVLEHEVAERTFEIEKKNIALSEQAEVLNEITTVRLKLI